MQTNERYTQPAVLEADYVPEIEEGAAAIPAALLNKLREGAFEGRRRAVAQQKSDEQKIWSLMWAKMSPASQSKVQECEGYEDALLLRDCVLLWEFIRRTHLTHIYGDGVVRYAAHRLSPGISDPRSGSSVDTPHRL